MRSIPHGSNPPDMKGRKTLMAGCRCCVWQDFREDYWRKQAELDVAEARGDFERGRTRR